MPMILLICVWVLGLTLLITGITGSIFVGKNSNNSHIYLLFVVLGFIFLLATSFFGVPSAMPSGLPKNSIDNGDYKVAFIYVAGENVSVGVERGANKDKVERLYLYQFPKSAFDSGSFKTDATELSVVEVNKFRKLVLK